MGRAVEAMPNPGLRVEAGEHVYAEAAGVGAEPGLVCANLFVTCWRKSPRVFIDDPATYMVPINRRLPQRALPAGMLTPKRCSP